MRRTKMTESVVVAAFLRSRAGKEEELAGRLQALVQASRSDPGVITYDLHHSTEDPASWFLYEGYESQEHLNRHRENAVLRSFLADAATLVDGKIDIRNFKIVPNLAGA
jgi:quinol monooxygenase YgiN